MEHIKTILTRCGITEEYYYNRFIDSGIEFLHWYSRGDATCIDLLQGLSSYWKWWAQQWNKREAIFMANIGDTRSGSDKLYKMWISLHTPENVIAVPPKFIIEESWNALMSDAWAEVSVLETKAKKSKS